MIRRPPRATLDRSSAASDVYKRQVLLRVDEDGEVGAQEHGLDRAQVDVGVPARGVHPVSYTHLRAHETVLDLVCRLLLEKKNTSGNITQLTYHNT